MKRNTKGGWIAFGVLAVAVLGGLGFAYSGAYNVGADDPHTRPVYALMETVRERSIAARAADLAVPDDLSSEARIRQGAGNYNAMCMGCHLAPGMSETELSRGLYPKPPNLTKETVDAAAAFWVIKHGIKASGMPAWGESMADEYIWNMAAFLQRLPRLDADGYQALVASSGGHSHGGNETTPHAHADGVADDHHAAPAADASHPHPPGTPPHDDATADPHAGMDMRAPVSEAGTDTKAQTSATPAAATTTHRHADGTVESHPATPPAQDDGHDHQH
jgi:mono/diheme cytochrome c family protein